ncbi:inositol monophosphatase 2-like isoform X1 [Portunus trituberculatus]|uniref:inositol monophosphatase 2-like isoform X1 n=1 Tax=Portunus trituberculatus TaxID=210409 RepID=UPI001E1CE686|nr:inositol monophosphatase 2-like isoform X1 [Portunus trituberculatus]
MDTAEIDRCFEVAVGLVKEAGQVVREAIKKQKKIEMKSSSVDLVTESDKAVEKLLIEGLSKAFPSHKFIGEESTADGAKCELTSDPTWIIDPIDGTMNFVHSLPYTCVSVGLWGGREALAGIIFNPVLDQMFTAKKGQGAYLNGERITVSGEKDLSKALVFAEMGTSHDPEKVKTVLANLTTLMPRVHGIRAMGSCALNMVMVAMGGADIVYEFGIHAWDTAAALVVVTEAGGVVVDTAGGPFDLMRRRVLCASTPELAKEIASLLSQYQPTPDGDLSG